MNFPSLGLLGQLQAGHKACQTVSSFQIILISAPVLPMVQTPPSLFG